MTGRLSCFIRHIMYDMTLGSPAFVEEFGIPPNTGDWKMAMFGFFLGKRKLALIRVLLEQRMRNSGFDDMEYRRNLKELSNIQIIGTPEGTLVTIVDTVVKLQRKGMLLRQALTSIENHRRRIGSEPATIEKILAISSGPDAGMSVPLYCKYRLDIEHPGRFSEEHLMKAFRLATEELWR